MENKFHAMAGRQSHVHSLENDLHAVASRQSREVSAVKTLSKRLRRAPELLPVPTNVTHQDSLFMKLDPVKPYFSVHPEWNSEQWNDPTPRPLTRPPWPWEQPRCRVNMQVPITYTSPAQMPDGGGGTLTPADRPDWDYSMEVPPLSYQLSRAYGSLQPQYVLRY